MFAGGLAESNAIDRERWGQRSLLLRLKEGGGKARRILAIARLAHDDLCTRVITGAVVANLVLLVTPATPLNDAALIPLTLGGANMNQFNKYLSAVFLAVTLGSVVGCAPTETKQGTGEYIDDSVITTKVKAAIAEDPLTKVLEVKVKTFKGEVQLSGFVSSREAANRAIELARGVNGVTSVKDDMQIK